VTKPSVSVEEQIYKMIGKARWYIIVFRRRIYFLEEEFTFRFKYFRL
jgi:hypothetical protein